MASKTSPPKPWEIRKATPANTSVPVSATVARSAQEPLDPSNSGLPIDRIDPAARNPHIGTGTGPRVPPRPGIGSSLSSYSSNYNSPLSRYGTYGSGIGGYGNSYSRYGSGYGSTYGSGIGSYGSNYGGGYGSGSGYGSTYGSGIGSYGSNYGSGYGSSYGGYGSSYGSNYGGYGSSVGGYGGYGNSYGRYGLGYREGAPPNDGTFQSVLNGGYSQMNRFGAVVESFSRFSHLLDANFDALHGSFASIIRLLDVFGEFFYVVRTFAVFRLLFGGFGKGWQLLNLALGRDVKRLTGGHDGIEIEDYKKFQSSQKPRNVPLLVMMGIIFASLPLLFIKIWRAINKMHLLEGLEPGRMDEAWHTENRGSIVKAKFSFAGETEMDLPFHEGDMIRLIGKPFPEWWEGEFNGRRGLFPSNFVEEVEDPKLKQV